MQVQKREKGRGEQVNSGPSCVPSTLHGYAIYDMRVPIELIKRPGVAFFGRKPEIIHNQLPVYVIF